MKPVPQKQPTIFINLLILLSTLTIIGGLLALLTCISKTVYIILFLFILFSAAEILLFPGLLLFFYELCDLIAYKYAPEDDGTSSLYYTSVIEEEKKHHDKLMDEARITREKMKEKDK